ncbi:MAG: hypothetical protein HY321_21780 [Armatimonadetes bacterium]|nr:hypothetical protein [Armatimonadota bacterium]
MATWALEQHINRIRRRIRLLQAVRWGVRFALAGTVASLAFLILSRILHVASQTEWVALLPGVSALAGAAFGALRRVTPHQAALAADARLALRERLSSGLYFLHHPDPDPMVSALVEDATRHSESIDVRRAFPVRATREAHTLAGALLVLALVLALPELPYFQSPAQRAERAAMKAEGARIVRVAKEVRRTAEARKVDLAKRVARNLEHLGEQMGAARISKKEALVKLNKLTREVADAQKQLAAADAGKSLAQAAAELRKAAAQAAGRGIRPAPDAAAKRLQAMADALAGNDMEKAAKLLEEMAEEAASSKMSREERQRAADQAMKMAQAMSGTQLDEAAKQLQEAAKQLQQGRTAQAARQMAQAGGT